MVVWSQGINGMFSIYNISSLRNQFATCIYTRCVLHIVASESFWLFSRSCDICSAADVLLSAEMAISPNRMRTASPDSGDSQNEKNGSAKATIVREVEAAMASQLEHYGDDGLKQWHSHLQNQLSEASHAHHQARDWLKQVGRELLSTIWQLSSVRAGNFSLWFSMPHWRLTQQGLSGSSDQVMD